MARRMNNGTQTAEPAGDQVSQPELSVHLLLVRVLAREVAREAWAA